MLDFLGLSPAELLPLFDPGTRVRLWCIFIFWITHKNLTVLLPSFRSSTHAHLTRLNGR